MRFYCPECDIYTRSKDIAGRRCIECGSYYVMFDVFFTEFDFDVCHRLGMFKVVNIWEVENES